MAEKTNRNPSNESCFKEAVCIDAGRIFDSCCDKDCLEDLQVYFTDKTQPIIDASTNVKCKKVETLNVFLEVDSVPFNRGFYSVDITFFFLVHLNAYSSPMSVPTPVYGLATFSKKVILYGSEGSVKIFTSNTDPGNTTSLNTNLPKASVQVADPICLACRLSDYCPCSDECLSVPPAVSCHYEGDFSDTCRKKTVYISLGLFTIVQLERNVQMMIPAYDYCLPDKECTTSTDDPCELFKRIKFPTNEFFPPQSDDLDDDCGCGCGCDEN